MELTREEAWELAVPDRLRCDASDDDREQRSLMLPSKGSLSLDGKLLLIDTTGDVSCEFLEEGGVV